jgi:hypothetical protein
MTADGAVLFADVSWGCGPPPRAAAAGRADAIHREAFAWWLRQGGGTMRYRKKPVEVDAVRWTGDNVAELAAFAGARFDTIDPRDRDDDADASVFDVLHSTWVRVYPGQWVIKGVRGEFYPCAHDVFEQTYEPVLIS